MAEPDNADTFDTPDDDRSLAGRIADYFSQSEQRIPPTDEVSFVFDKFIAALEVDAKPTDSLKAIGKRDARARELVFTADYELITSIIPDGSKVLDLGCGNGELLQRLRRRNTIGQGVEIDPDNIVACIRRGVPVIHANIDEGLNEYGDHSYDYVILNRVLQQAFNVDVILKEMLRVGKRGIVSFPNFGYWEIRLQLALSGIMPVSKMLPFSWYDTPNIRLLTINDFINLVDQLGLSIIESHWFVDGQVSPDLRFPNAEAEEALFVLTDN